jgi:putative transcriptional regulator
MTGKRLTNSIRTLRFHAGEMTQGELGEKIGVTRQTVAAIEQGKYSPTLETAFRIADIFAVPLEQVFSWAEE